MGHSLNAKYGLKRVINASGRMSILGVSAPTDTVMDAMKQGGQNYVEIADLVDKAGDHIARHSRIQKQRSLLTQHRVELRSLSLVSLHKETAVKVNDFIKK